MLNEHTQASKLEMTELNLLKGSPIFFGWDCSLSLRVGIVDQYITVIT